MKFLFDFFPVIIFFSAFKLYGIYAATVASIAAAVVQVGVFWLKHRRFERMHVVTLVVLAVFGGLTLALHDDTFIKWKPTIVNWAFAILLLGSQWLGQKNALEHMLSDNLALPKTVWRNMNISWAVFFIFLGALNLYVAFYYALDQSAEVRQEMWVNFKVFGLLGLTFVFTIVQALFLARHLHAGEKDRA